MPEKSKGPEIPPELLKAAKEQALQEIVPLFASFYSSILEDVLSDKSLQSREEFMEALQKRVSPAIKYGEEFIPRDASLEHLKVAFTKAEFQKWLDGQTKK